MTADTDADLTPAERFAALTPEEQEAVLAGKPVDGPLADAGDDDLDDDADSDEGDPWGRDRPDDSHEVDGEHVPHFVADGDEDDEGYDPDLFQFTLGRRTEPTKGARVLTGRRPKAAVLMQLAIVDPNTKDLGTIAHVINTFLDHVLDKPSRDFVRSRFLDPDDDWDVDMLVPVIQACKARWYGGRPTGRATGSSGSPGSRGSRSKGRSPSKGRKKRGR